MSLVQMGVIAVPFLIMGCERPDSRDMIVDTVELRKTEHAEYELDAIVDEVYTFASPPLTKGQELTNGQMSDGCFPGLRVWSRSVHGHVDPVAKARFGFIHTRQTTLEFKVEGKSDQTLELDNISIPVWQGTTTQTGCTPDSRKTPSSMGCINFPRCHIDYYYFDYASVGFPDLGKYHRMCKDTELKWSHETISLEASKNGYRVVGHATVTSKIGKDEDHVLLYQEEDSLSCVMAIEGSDRTAPDWFSNFNIGIREWCGFEKVHLGLLEELTNLVQHESYVANVKAKLPHCARVTVTGHSKGGGLTNLFAACVNRASVPDSARVAYEAITWKHGDRKLMPAIW